MQPTAAQLFTWYRTLLGWSLAIGIVASVGLAVGAAFDPAQFFRAYLAAYLFYFGLTLGSMAVLMIYHTTGGAWGYFVRRFLEAGVRTLPLVILAFVPVALGIHYLYPWAMPGDDSRIIEGQRVYMTETFFFGRAVAYFVLWSSLAWGLTRWSVLQDRTRRAGLADWLDGISGVGLLIYGVTIHFAAVDWIMALQPIFHSTIFGPIVVAGQMLSALALAIAAVCVCADRRPFVELLSPKSQIDLGNLLLSFVAVWTYLCWFQYLLGWIANLPYDAVWYVPRLRDGWQWVALALVLLHFAVPLLLLLWRAVKRSRVLLGSVAGLLLASNLLFDLYQVLPAFAVSGIEEYWMAFVAPFALGGIWFACFLWRLSAFPILPEYDFNETQALVLHHSDEQEAAWEELFSNAR